ncbi:MAG: type II toxin-antitoxin system RelE/ParE family toxin [Nanoarchaeota archaeon]|nr:type II toxin-antitoxin system RelE/ParE family toxin [Nanoarchaeota archaeon]MBU1027796.1 type II toxin-antitoxin system RelE/ParE family toxin [Nanoarchaeota archaeon]
MYSLEFRGKALRQLEKLPIELQRRIASYLDRLKVRPFSHDIKRLQGSPYYRARVGNYRIILDIKRDILIIVVIQLGLRHKVYK